MDEVTKRKRGRLPTGRTTAMVRIPIALKPAVAALVVDYRAARQRALDAAPLKKPVLPDRDTTP